MPTACVRRSPTGSARPSNVWDPSLPCLRLLGRHRHRRLRVGLPARVRRRWRHPDQRGLNLRVRRQHTGPHRPRRHGASRRVPMRHPTIAARVAAGTAPARVRSFAGRPGTSAERGDPAGRWSVTPAPGRTPSAPTASPTPSATPSCSPALHRRRQRCGRARRARRLPGHPRPPHLALINVPTRSPARWTDVEIPAAAALTRRWPTRSKRWRRSLPLAPQPRRRRSARPGQRTELVQFAVAARQLNARGCAIATSEPAVLPRTTSVPRDRSRPARSRP